MSEKAPKNIDRATGKPLRHGWGGDLKKREQALREEQEELIERKLHPEKFGEGDTKITEFTEDFFQSPDPARS